MHCMSFQVPALLNSNECFLLQSGSSLFSWHGNQSTFEQQQLAAKVAEFLKVCFFSRVPENFHQKHVVETNECTA